MTDFTVVLGNRPGRLAAMFGHQPYRDEKGAYKFRSVTEKIYSYPDELPQFLAAAMTDHDSDVYVCPAIRQEPHRRKGGALPPQVCWADLDGPPKSQALYDTLNPLAVDSGTSGHVHAYVPLSKPVPLKTHRLLQEALRDQLGGDDKIADNDLLRWPGTFNHKTDPPGLVKIRPGTPTVWEPERLASLLGVELEPSIYQSQQQDTTIVGGQPIDQVPDRLLQRFADAANPVDRSAAFHGLVGACKDARLTQGQTVTMMNGWKPGVDKYGAHRIADEVARCWGKVEDKYDMSWAGAPESNGQQAPPSSPTHPQPDKYFSKNEGLLVATLAADIIGAGPLAEGGDDLVWSYHNGVWAADKHVVRSRTAHLLGERYRRSHGGNTEDVVRARSPRITCEPISEAINFRNGLYYWQADQLREHTPDVHSTVQLSVDYNPEATCPEFDTFIAQVVPADMVPLVWELIGYLMYSGNPLHKAVMLMGRGRNGKGTLLRVVNALLGDRNVTSVSLHDLVNTRFSTASLFGKIANIAGDIDGTYLESTATFKAITGQDMISAEHKGRDRFDFTPWAVPVFSANKIPASSDVTTGYLSRWLVIPFPHDFTGREDRKLDSRLQTKAELQGVAAKAAPALRRLMARGDFDLPESGREARDEFTRRVDQVRTWLNECCQVDPGLPWVNRTDLHTAYKAWCARDNYKALKAGEFYDRLESVPGLEHKVIHGTRGFSGCTLVDRADQQRWPGF